MRTRRTFRWLLASLLSLVILLPAVGGQAAGDAPLVAAARNDDLQTVRALIARRPDVNEHAPDGSTAILWATYHSNLDMARALIAAGAAVNTPNHYGITPLLQASRAGDAPLIAALLKAGADFAVTHPDGETPLMAASRTGRAFFVSALTAVSGLLVISTSSLPLLRDFGIVDQNSGLLTATTPIFDGASKPLWRKQRVVTPSPIVSPGDLLPGNGSRSRRQPFSPFRWL